MMKCKNKMVMTFYCILVWLVLFCGQASALIFNYTYDHLDRLTRVETDDGSVIIDYSYDSAGNRLSVNSAGVSVQAFAVRDSGVYGLGNTGGLDIVTPFYGEEYGNITYSYAIGSACNSADLINWTAFTPVSANTHLAVLNLPYLQSLIISVQIRNFAGELLGGTGCSNGITLLNPAEDQDNDGFSNGEEITAKSDPLRNFSSPAQTTVNLKKGFNMLNFPAEMLYFETAEKFLDALGGNTAVSTIQLFNKLGTFNLAGYDINGNFYGENFQITPGAFTTGMIVDAKKDLTFSFTSKLCPPWDLKPGTNLVGTACIPPGKTAFQLLQEIGNETVITSVQRFNSETGKFETASYRAGVPEGVNFILTPNDAYLIHMKQESPGFVSKP